jgi:hypothetical protein
MNRAQQIIGDGKNRKENDFYATPPYAVQALLDKEQFIGNILEPACGEGHISKVLINNNYKVDSFDLIDRGYGAKQDFLTYTGFCDNIITNPPFTLALEFVLKAKEVSKNKFALLLKTQFLEGIKRQPMFLDEKFPLKKVLVFSKRLTFGEKQTGGMLSFSWFLWQKDWEDKPYMDWI